MADRGFKVEDDLALCGAHLALPALSKKKVPIIKGKIREKNSSLFEYAFTLSKLLVKCRRNTS